ncbi:MerR family transcriptional regulator [Catenuloplanes indicus]|uniref:DNA-binding transcriptional MerR regulator n=1 Tax=Catenuloplanes indicus TaxID=137267 RepID=A0AAE3W289_9ACTN|nr:MerR family transcriptional regulator [Catenuloplanes indicus]MDQ0368578.1 DNA-binding transcriptional MerR regulator [Catenuloplanes indicus]
MFSIGQFAVLGRLSVRMLRHYDAIGLLRPARVDELSGYRYYSAAQLSRLNRIVALKDLGFSLDQVGRIVDERVDAGQLRGMLRLRQAELAERVSADRARLARVAARLRLIESEGQMATEEVVIKDVPAVRVAQLSAPIGGWGPEHISPVLGPLFQDLCTRVETAGIRIVGPGVAHYATTEAGEGSTVFAAVPVPAGTPPHPAFDVLDLPALPAAATVIHRGRPDEIEAAYQTLGAWVEQNGYRGTAPPREVSLEVPEDRAAWVTEVQLPVTRA